MRKFAFALLFWPRAAPQRWRGSFGTCVPDDAPQAVAEKPRTMEEVVNRVVSMRTTCMAG